MSRSRTDGPQPDAELVAVGTEDAGCAVSLDESGERVIAFDDAFTVLTATERGLRPGFGDSISELFAPRHAEVLRVAIARARSAGRAPAMLHEWGATRHHYRVDVRFDSSRSSFDLHIARLRASSVDPNELFANALRQNVTEMIVVADRDLRIRALNAPYAAAATAVLGRQVQIGDSVNDTMLPGTTAVWDGLFARALAGEPVLEDVVIVLKIGVKRTYEVTLNPIRGVTGEVEGVVIISRNVTRRRDEEEELKRAAEARRAILEAMPEAIAVVRRDGNIVDFKGSADAPAVDPSSLVGRNIREVPHVIPEPVVGLLDLAFETRLTHRVEAEVLVDGALRTRDATVRAISEAEAVTVVRDVTEQRQAARRLAFADRMASLGTLAAGVAHELNNPLFYVTTNLKFIPRLLGGSAVLTPEARTALEDALEGLERMRGIVASLRTFSQPHEDMRAVVDLAAVVAGAVKLTTLEIMDRASIELDLGAEVHVHGSDAGLSQVFVNLLLNAVQALDPSRRSRNVIRARVTPLDAGRAVVEIADNGTGIPAAIRGRVFDPFFTTKPVGEGTGLGLSISRQIVCGHGGEIDLESVEGEGTVFRVILPIAEPGVSSTRTPVPRAAAHAGARILVIDDEPAVRLSLSRLLSEWQTTSVASAREGIAALEDGSFDLVLCDVMMPGKSGVDFYLEVASRWPGREETIALMTGGTLTEEQAFALGASTPTVLGKPFDPEAVERCLSRAIKANRTRKDPQ